jgi:hypothetical protein
MCCGRMDEAQDQEDDPCECCGELGHDVFNCPVAQGLCEDGESDPFAGGVNDARTSTSRAAPRGVHAAIGKRLRAEPKAQGF